MKKITLFAVLFLFSLLSLNAHNPQISTVALVQNKDNQWHLIISAGLSAYQYELKNTDMSINLDSLNADKFQRMIVAHLRKKITIKANGDETELKNAKVILGHQTDINFEVAGMPDELLSLDMEHLGFGTLKDHFCVLKVVTRDNESTNYILQNDNNHAVSFALKNKIFVETPKENTSNTLIVSLLVLVSAFVVAIAYFKNKKIITY